MNDSSSGWFEAQQRAVRRYLAGHAGDLVAKFIEVESRKKITNRPQLQPALAECRCRKTKLISQRGQGIPTMKE